MEYWLVIGWARVYHFLCMCKECFSHQTPCDTYIVSSFGCATIWTAKMDELKDINLLATIEGQDYEESLRKIVSEQLFLSINPSSYLIFWSGQQICCVDLVVGLYTATFHPSRSFSYNRRNPKAYRQNLLQGRDQIWHSGKSYHWWGLQHWMHCKSHSNAFWLITRSTSHSNAFVSQYSQ